MNNYKKSKMFKPEFILNNKVNWARLSSNPNAIHILEKNLDKVDWSWLSENPKAIHLFGKLDKDKMRENCRSFAEKLAKYVFHPLRLQKLSEQYGFDMEEYFELI